MEFETLYQELRNSTDIIAALLSGVSQEEAQFKPTPETWSILEVTCHLHDEEREDFRQRLDYILHRPEEEFPAIDPQGWIGERHYSEQDFQTMQDRFFSERRKSLQWLKGMADVNWDTTHTSQHGSVTAGEMFSSWVAHDNLHIRQLVELRRARIENITKPYPIEYAGGW